MIGLPNGFGGCMFGWSKFGDWNPAAGIYQAVAVAGKQVIRKLRFYWPKNPNTPEQIKNRGDLRDAVVAWQNLTDEQKEVYNESARGLPMSGFNLFVKSWLNSH